MKIVAKVVGSLRDLPFPAKGAFVKRGQPGVKKSVLCDELEAVRLRPDEWKGGRQVDVLVRFPGAYRTVNSRSS